MTDTEKAMAFLISIFDKYASKDKDRCTLSKEELKDFLQNELPEMTGKTDNKAEVDRIFKGLDQNKDNTVDFEEFGSMIFMITAKCHEHFCKK